MEVDEAHGTEKDIPSHNFPFLPAVLDHEKAAWSWHFGQFIHSFHNDLLCLLPVWSFSPACCRHFAIRQV